MSQVAELLARTDFTDIWNSGDSLAVVAQRLGCNRKAVQKAARALGLTHPKILEQQAMDAAPSEAEEILSRESLALAPSVAAIAEEVKQEMLDAMREGRQSRFTLRTYKKRQFGG